MQVRDLHILQGQIEVTPLSQKINYYRTVFNSFITLWHVEDYKENDFKLLFWTKIYFYFSFNHYFSPLRGILFTFCFTAFFVPDMNKKINFCDQWKHKEWFVKTLHQTRKLSFAMTMGTRRNFQVRFIEGRGIDFQSWACCVSHAGCLLACNINEVATQNTAHSHWFNFSWGVIQSSQFSNMIACIFD